MRRISTRTVARVLFGGAAGVALCVAAYLRGDFLFGPGAGVYYAAVVLGLLWLFARSRSTARAAVVAALSLAVAFALTWPAAINPNVSLVMERIAERRAIQAELAAVLESDAAYSKLTASFVQTKIVNIKVNGPLSTRSPFDRLRSRIMEECPTLGGCDLSWNVIVLDTEQHMVGRDEELFPANKSAD